MDAITASVRHAMHRVEIDAWVKAKEAYRTSTGPAHVEARHVFQPMVRAERMRLRRQWAELDEAVRRSMARRAA